MIAIADLDLISEQFFELRRRKIENLDFDNVTFVLNCVDVLAGDDSFVALRKRRPKHRTLERLEDQTKRVHRGAPERDQGGRGRGQGAARRGPEAARQAGRGGPRRKDLDERTKEIMLVNLQEVANRRLDVEKAKIEDEKRKKIQESKADIGAEDPRDPEPGPRLAAGSCRPCRRWSWAWSSSASGSAARTWGPTRTGSPEPDRRPVETIAIGRSGLIDDDALDRIPRNRRHEQSCRRPWSSSPSRLLLTGAAVDPASRDRSGADEAFNDQGQPFFPDFKDPLACTDLEVVDFDPSTATASRFQVMFKDGKWVIPSHYDYPADAKDRLAKTAAGVMDLTKDTIRSDRAEDQEDDGRDRPARHQGRRRSRGAASGSRSATRPRRSWPTSSSATRSRTAPASGYVRVPGPEADLRRQRQGRPSTRFADWIETNLLKLDASQDPQGRRSTTTRSTSSRADRRRASPRRSSARTRAAPGP